MRSLLVALLLLVAVPALAAEPVGVRLGAHDGYGRVVFEFGAPVGFTVDRSADKVVLRFAQAATIPSMPGRSRNIVAIEGGESVATVTVAPGARIQASQLDRRVVLDVYDANPTSGQAKASKPALMRQNPTHPPRETALPVPDSALPAAKTAAAPVALPKVERPQTAVERLQPPPPVAVAPTIEPAPVMPVVRHNETEAPQPSGGGAPPPVAPISVSAEPVTAPAGTRAPAALLPFGQDVGAAAFRRAGEAWIVFDESRPLDLASFKDNPAFGDATVQLLPAGTLLRVPLKDTDNIRLRHQSRGWIVAIEESPPAASLTPVARANQLFFQVPGTGQVVVVADPATGQNLLVGTLRTAGPGVPIGYRVPEFSVLPSWQGVVAEPLSDRTVLKTLPDGVALETGDTLSNPPDTARALADAAVLTRRFDFPALPVTSLLRRLQAQSADAAAAPAQGRLEPRKAAVQTMIALGLGPEAQSLLQLAATEDPRAVADPVFNGLTGIAALLSGRTAEAQGLLDPGLSGTDEVALWRAALAATRQEGSPEAAALFKTATKLILSYPSALRHWLLPLAAETMATGGAPEAADTLLEKLQDEPRLTLARAMRLQAKGDSAGALAIYDALAAGRDRLVSARAATFATLLRLSTHAIGPAQAADSLEKAFLDWRGDEREWNLRLQAIDLRAQAGQWRTAFNLLKETAALYPENGAILRDRTGAMLATLLHSLAAATLPPIELVTLAEENAEDAAKAAPDEVTSLLADRLVALDLPRRAAPVLERMIAAAPPGVGRATLGARLAALRLAEGDASGTAALSETEAPDLPGPLVEQRGLLEARLHALGKDVAGATAVLAQIDSEAADDLRANILADAGDWRGSEAALSSLANRTIPSTGELNSSQQDTLLRLASAQAKAGDDEAARQLGIRESGRMAGPRADMFRLLTSAPVNGVGDLRRAGGEIALARAIPAALSAIGSK